MKTYLKFLLFLSIVQVFAQKSSDELGIWYTIQGHYKLNDTYSVTGISQLRQYEVGNNMNFYFVQGNFNWLLNKKWGLSVGYLYGLMDTSILGSNSPNIFENRFFEQVFLNSNLGNIKIENRCRFEQRLLNKETFNATEHRFRYRLKAKIPINKTLYFKSFDELILNISKNSDVFQQNRLYGALGINVYKHCSLELGYMNHQFLETNLDRLQVGIYFY